MMVRPKHQRLVLVILALAAVLGAVLLAMWGLKDRAAYFYTPADIAAGKAKAGESIRIGGMVEKGSIGIDPEDPVTTLFVVTDGNAKTHVHYRGIVPDLFREGSGVVAEGQVDENGIFIADKILAKHDERYMPPELGNQAAEHKAGQTLKR